MSDEQAPEVVDPIAALSADVAALTEDVRRAVHAVRDFKTAVSGPAADICRIIEAAGGRPVRIITPSMSSSGSSWSTSGTGGWTVVVGDAPEVAS